MFKINNLKIFYVLVISYFSLYAHESNFQIDNFDIKQKASKHYLMALQLENDRKIPESIKNFKIAAKSGHDKAAYFLAHKYLEGQGVKKSDKKCIKYLNIAKNNGNKDAARELFVIDLLNFLQQNNNQIKLDDNQEQIFKSVSSSNKAGDQIDYNDYLQIGSDVLNIFGYGKIAMGLEKLGLVSRVSGVIYKLFYGITDTVLQKLRKTHTMENFSNSTDDSIASYRGS